MGPSRPWPFIAGVLFLLSVASAAHAAPSNPCVRATADCVAADRFLAVTCHVELHNRDKDAANILLLPAPGVLEKVEGLTGRLVLNKQGGALYASVPPGWRGELTLHLKQPVSPPSAGTPSAATVSLPPAPIRSLTVELPGRDMELTVAPTAIVRRAVTSATRTRFQVTPLEGDVYRLTWRQAPPDRRGRFSLRQDHRIAADAAGFRDEAELTFLLNDQSLPGFSVTIPDGASLASVQVPHGALWSVKGRTLRVTPPDGFDGRALTVACRLEGLTAIEGDTHLLTVPLFGAPDAERHEGRVMIGADAYELTFAELTQASQTAVQGGDGDSWRLACDVHGPDARAVVRISRIAARREATVDSHYRLAAFRCVAEHTVRVVDHGVPIDGVELTLPAGEVVRRVIGSNVKEWSQDGTTVHVGAQASAGHPVLFRVQTERLTGVRRTIALAPPVVKAAVAVAYTLGVTSDPDVLLKPAEEAERLRVPPDSLGDWLKSRSPTLAYRYRGAVTPISVDILPVEAEVHGEIQDHVEIFEDRVLRESLFLLEVRRQALQELAVIVPAGLTVERVDGPLVEDWSVRPEDGALLVRFRQAFTGENHFRLACSRPFEPGRMVVRALRLEQAPHVQGWLGVSSEVSIRVRPMEDGWTNIASMRVGRAPAYLKGFQNRFLYEFYDSRWQLELQAEPLPPVYSAKVLEEISFRAGQAHCSALFAVEVQQGGVGELSFDMPAAASGSQFRGDDVAQSRLEDARWHVRFRGKRTGTLHFRIDYAMPTGTGDSSVQLEPVRLVGAKKQSGIVLLTQARPDVEVGIGQVPRALSPAEARERYEPWSYSRANPALATFTYNDANWRLPLNLSTPDLSEMMLQASVPLAKLDTLMQAGKESLNHLRLYVSNTNRQFLTVDMGAAAPQARLIGTYVYGEPVKPFRQGTKLQLPLFTSEQAVRYGMAVVDITYAEPHGGLGVLGRRSLGLPELGLNVGKFEWTVRVPEGYRLSGIDGNMDKPVEAPAPPRSLGARLAGPLGQALALTWRQLLCLALIVFALFALYLVAWVIHRLFLRKTPLRSVVWSTVLIVVLSLVLAGMLMPALSRPRMSSRTAAEQSNLHNVGLAISMYRQAHGEQYPPQLEHVLSDDYLEDREQLTSPLGEGRQLRYAPPRGRGPDEVVAYFWGPPTDVANLLFVDGSIRSASPNELGDLINPRNGEVIARAWELGTTQLARREKKAFAGRGVEVEELAEALAVEQTLSGKQMAASRSQADADRILTEATLEANINALNGAFKKYAEEHGGRRPTTADELNLYVADSRLRDAVQRGWNSPRMQDVRGRADLGVLRGLAGGMAGGEPQQQVMGDLARPIDQLDLDAQTQALDMPQQAQSMETDKVGEDAAGARYNLGMAYLGKGDYDNAVDNFRRALDLKADHAQARRQLSQVEALQRATKGQKVATAPAATPEMADQLEERAAGRMERHERASDLALIEKALTEKEEGGLGYAVPAARSRARYVRQPARPDEYAAPSRGPVPAERDWDGQQVAMTGAAPQAAPVGQPVAMLQPPRTKGSLVRQLGGGRSTGALPIAIDFPSPATVSYEFVKPFVGRARPAVSFRAVGIGAVLSAELTAAALALLAFVLVRRRNPSRAVSVPRRRAVRASLRPRLDRAPGRIAGRRGPGQLDADRHGRLPGRRNHKSTCQQQTHAPS